MLLEVLQGVANGDRIRPGEVTNLSLPGAQFAGADNDNRDCKSRELGAFTPRDGLSCAFPRRQSFPAYVSTHGVGAVVRGCSGSFMRGSN